MVGLGLWLGERESKDGIFGGLGMEIEEREWSEVLSWTAQSQRHFYLLSTRLNDCSDCRLEIGRAHV